MSLFRFNPIKFLFAVVLALIVLPAQSKVYYSKQEAMVLAFGEQADVEMLSLFPDQQQQQQIEQNARAKLGSSLFTFYVGKKQGQVVGYAALETQTVRTKPETLLIILDSNGNLKDIHTLAFHEPPEYQPPKKWYDLLKSRSIDELQLNQSIQGISGATLSTRAALNSSRKVLSVFQHMVKQHVTQP
ncbi:MAG: FMN-binding protein [Gammaproteobacteria bacterium]|nr:FMN-binding protein [Gammaproteobacteria bacterium]